MSKSLILLLLAVTVSPLMVSAADYSVDFELPASADGFEKADWLAYGLTGVGWDAAPERASMW